MAPSLPRPPPLCIFCSALLSRLQDDRVTKALYALCVEEGLMLTNGLAKRFLAISVLGLSAWGLGCVAPPRPQAPTDPSVIETDAPLVYVIVQPVDEGTPIAEGQTSEGGGWVPNAPAEPSPFYHSAHWVGDYDCAQGNTNMAFRILDVRGSSIRAVFDFHHLPSAARGSYLMRGTYDAETRKVEFEPTQWIIRPEHYYMVGMVGEVSLDGSLFAGKIKDERCGAFQLKPTR